MVAPLTAGRPRGTTQVVTRSTTNDRYEVAGTRYGSYEVAGTRWQGMLGGSTRRQRLANQSMTRVQNARFKGARRVSVRGCHLEIQGNNEAVSGEQKDYNTIRSCNMSGG
ncbi:hypothetical protein Tco_1350658 [Tanacetum coccineum]